MAELSLWWLKLGIKHERIEPGKPQQQRALDLLSADFNDERPHEALGQRTPASIDQPSRRPLPVPSWGKEFTYPAHWEIVRLSAAGLLVFNDRRATMGQTFAHQLVGLSWTEQGWDVTHVSNCTDLTPRCRGVDDWTSLSCTALKSHRHLAQSRLHARQRQSPGHRARHPRSIVIHVGAWSLAWGRSRTQRWTPEATRRGASVLLSSR